MPEGPDKSQIPFAEFLRICVDSGLLAQDTSRLMHNFARALGGVGSIPRVSGDSADMLQTFESILGFDYPDNMTFDSYISTEENYYTCEILRTVAFIPRIWNAIAPIFIHASTGQGKTHLLAATMNATSRKALLINTLDLETEFQHSKSAGRERELRDWMITHHLILIDDIQFARGNRGFEEFIISVMNRMPRETHGIVVSSDMEPSLLTGMDRSLLSRLMAGITIKLEIVNKRGRYEILEQFFRYTGMTVSEEVVDYLAETFTTNVRQLKAAARMVLARMLGTGTAMTVESTRTLLGFMTSDIGSNSRILFEDDVKAPEKPDREEFIVVEVEEESETVHSGSGHDPLVTEPVESMVAYFVTSEPVHAEPVRSEPAPSESVPATSKQPEPSPGQERVEAAPAWNEFSRTVPAEKAEKPVSRRTGTGSAKKFKDMVASADTVEKQTEALRLAVSERIRQLSDSGGNGIEVGRLQVTLRFLERGDLEAAMYSLKS